MKRQNSLLLDLLDSSSDDEWDSEFDNYVASRSKNRKIWEEDHIRTRKQRGEFNLYKDLSDGKFTSYFRNPRDKFNELHELIKEDIKKINTHMRESISTEERLCICLRYLSTGDSYRTIAFSYRVGESTVSQIVDEVCDALWKRLQPLVLAEPSQDNWKQIAKEFKEKCQFDHCCGAIDGKHVVVKCPPNSGTSFFNYKHTFSTVLLAVADARRRFVVIDVGSKGRFCDSRILDESEFGKKLKNGTVRFPEEEPLISGGLDMPYVLVGDEAFPLTKNLMRSYPKTGLNNKRRTFNYRLCRARRVVENAFGILSARWRVYKRPLECKVESVDKVVKATCVLHNFMIQSSDTYFNILHHNRIRVNGNDNQLLRLTNQGFNYSNESFFIREEFCHYFSTIGRVPWQQNRIQRMLSASRRDII